MLWLNTSRALLGCIVGLFGLSAALLLHLGWSQLAVATLLLLLCWPALACWYALHRREHQQWLQLRSYVSALSEGDRSYQLLTAQLSEPARHLYQQLAQLEQRLSAANTSTNNPGQLLLFSALWQHLPYPVCLFDASQRLLFANAAACHSLQRPLLSGSDATLLGFCWRGTELHHPDFQTGWQQHLVQVQLQGQSCLIFYAADLRHPLYQQQKASQHKLVRVLSHELRNSLTPMASMTETLLSAAQLPQQQTRQVLRRIQQRSQRLLGFIDSFLQLQQLPAPNKQWLPLASLLAEFPQAEYVRCSGEQYCYADPDQLAQLLLNLLKNAVEACDGQTQPAISLCLFYRGEQQLLTVTDNGPGFANTENLFTPFYTTKSAGAGIGLLLCQEIIHAHQGSITAFNTANGHGCIELCWPLPAAQLS